MMRSRGYSKAQSTHEVNFVLCMIGPRGYNREQPSCERGKGNGEQERSGMERGVEREAKQKGVKKMGGGIGAWV